MSEGRRAETVMLRGAFRYGPQRDDALKVFETLRYFCAACTLPTEFTIAIE